MLKMPARATLMVLLVGAFTCLSASSPAIGLAVSNGSLQVDRSQVWGATTLFEGSTIETRAAASELKLNGGAQMRLAAESRATVYARRLVLEKGYGQLEASASYEIEARSLRVLPEGPDAMARVSLDGDRNVTVAAVRGAVRVRNATGVLVANVQAGKAVNFEPQAAGAAAPTKASGCVLKLNGKVILVDQTTNVTLELQGPGLEDEIGNSVEIMGAPESIPPTAPGASQVVRVAAVKRIAVGRCSSAPAKPSDQAGGGAGAPVRRAGRIGGATIAVIGGVAAAATAGGLAAVGGSSGQSESLPPASR